MIAWEKCAEANERTGNDWHAGKHLEQCAQLAKDLKQHDQVVAYAERACAAYVSAGRAQRGAECLGKTARLIDEAAPDDAYALAIKACTMLEDDDKASYARDFYSLAGAIRMRQEMFAEAAETMLRFGASCDAGEAHASLRKALELLVGRATLVQRMRHADTSSQFVACAAAVCFASRRVALRSYPLTRAC